MSASEFIPAHARVVAPGASPGLTAFVLHGILGFGVNWRTFAQRLVSDLPDWEVILVDMRNHGDSGSPPGPHDLESTAADLDRLARRLGRHPAAMLGHSFGGKVALTYARNHPGELEQVWVLDVAPGVSDRQQQNGASVTAVLDAAERVSLDVPRRGLIVDALIGDGMPERIARWLGTNLRRAGGGYAWRFDLAGVREMMRSFRSTDFWPFVESRPDGLEIHIVRAADSDVWSDGELAQLERVGRSGAAHVHVLSDAGHWLHTDNPRGLEEMVAQELARISPSPFPAR
jgi:pimeloyl-ACP methyl ester carboxylesterase